jgi:hypothetical protein
MGNGGWWMVDGGWRMVDEIPDVLGCHIVILHYSTMGIGKRQMAFFLRDHPLAEINLLRENCVSSVFGNRPNSFTTSSG